MIILSPDQMTLLNPTYHIYPRSTALVRSVRHLVLLTKNACGVSGGLDWMDTILLEVEDCLKVGLTCLHCHFTYA